MVSKVSVDEVFTHYFEKMFSASAPGPRWEDFRPLYPTLPTLGKNPAGAHA